MSSALKLDDIGRRMDASVEVLRKDLQGLRTGRASASLLEPVMVEAYGGTMHLKECASVNVPEPRMLSVQVWDRALVKAVDKAIRQAGLGLNPVVEGQVLRVPLPELTQERRMELVKSAHKYAEQTRVAVRNIRQEAMNNIKRMGKEDNLPEDQVKKLSDDVQKLTDKHIELIAKVLEQKEKDIQTV